jgi:hypothetical protein
MGMKETGSSLRTYFALAGSLALLKILPAATSEEYKWVTALGKILLLYIPLCFSLGYMAVAASFSSLMKPGKVKYIYALLVLCSLYQVALTVILPDNIISAVITILISAYLLQQTRRIIKECT